jgi:hypothetical protein
LADCYATALPANLREGIGDQSGQRARAVGVALNKERAILIEPRLCVAGDQADL